MPGLLTIALARRSLGLGGEDEASTSRGAAEAIRRGRIGAPEMLQSFQCLISIHGAVTCIYLSLLNDIKRCF